MRSWALGLAYLLVVILVLCVRLGAPLWVQALGRPGEGVVSQAWFDDNGRCVVSFSYQAAPGVAPRDSQTAPSAACRELKPMQKVPIRFLALGPAHFAALAPARAPAPLTDDSRRGIRRILILLAFGVPSIGLLLRLLGGTPGPSDQRTARRSRPGHGPFLGR